MIIKYSSILLLLVLLAPERLALSDKNVIQDSITAKDLLPMGRTRLRGDSLELVSSGVHFGIAFKGRDLKLYV